MFNITTIKHDEAVNSKYLYIITNNSSNFTSLKSIWQDNNNKYKCAIISFYCGGAAFSDMPAAETDMKFCRGFILTEGYYKLIVCKNPNTLNLYIAIAMWESSMNQINWYKYIGTAVA